jgi:hypothetical protein
MMSEAPARCIDCTLATPSACNATTATEGKNVLDIHPGPDCPFVRLDQKDAEIERLRNLILIAVSTASALGFFFTVAVIQVMK